MSNTEKILINDVVWFVYHNTIYKSKVIDKVKEEHNVLVLYIVEIGLDQLYFNDYELYKTKDELVEAMTYKEKLL